MPIWRFPAEEINTELQQRLKENGDYLFFEISDEPAPDYFHLGYYHSSIFNKKTNTLCQATDVALVDFRKIKKSDYEKYFENNFEKLSLFISERLINIVGIDFDRTLTLFNTETEIKKIRRNHLTIATNRLFEKATDAIIHALVALANTRTIIATNNYSTIVKEYLTTWHLPQLPIFSLGDQNKKAGLINKTRCFTQACEIFVSNSTEYINFAELKQNKDLGIDVIACTLVDDDDEDKELYLNAGINFILASQKAPDHLLELNEIFNLKVDVKSLCPKEDKNFPFNSTPHKTPETPPNESTDFYKSMHRELFFTPIKENDNAKKQKFSKNTTDNSLNSANQTNKENLNSTNYSAQTNLKEPIRPKTPEPLL